MKCQVQLFMAIEENKLRLGKLSISKQKKQVKPVEVVTLSMQQTATYILLYDAILSLFAQCTQPKYSNQCSL